MDNFSITLRLHDNSTHTETGTWEDVRHWCYHPQVTAWEIRRNQIVLAQSRNYSLGHPVERFMRRIQIYYPEVFIINDLYVQITDVQRVYIYFIDTMRPGDPCLKIFNGTQIDLVGHVTAENYDGFVKAATLAKNYLKSAF